MRDCSPAVNSGEFMTTFETARDIVTREGWLSLMPASFRQSVLERCVMQRFAAGEGIYQVGDGPGGIYGLVSGSVRITIAPGDEGPFFAHLMQPGIWVGEGPALSGQPRLVGLSAGRDSEVLHLPLAAIHALVEAQPAVWRFIGALALINVQMAIGVVNDLMIRDDAKRFIATLLRLGSCRLASPARTPPIPVDASQEELGTMSNLARTTVSALLKRLEAAGLVATDYRRVIILQPDRLRAMLN